MYRVPSGASPKGDKLRSKVKQRSECAVQQCSVQAVRLVTLLRRISLALSNI